MKKFKYSEADIIARHPDYPYMVMSREEMDLIMAGTKKDTMYFYSIMNLNTGHVSQVTKHTVDNFYYPIEEWQDPQTKLQIPAEWAGEVAGGKVPISLPVPVGGVLASTLSQIKIECTIEPQ